MSAVSILTEYVPAEVDLWGAKYETVDLGKKGFKKLTKVQSEIETLAYDDDAVDTLVAKVAEFCDIKLVAVEGNVKASTLIKKKWDAEILKARQLGDFIGRVNQAEVEANRPS
jgi:hypothetical protein